MCRVGIGLGWVVRCGGSLLGGLMIVGWLLRWAHVLLGHRLGAGIMGVGDHVVDGLHRGLVVDRWRVVSVGTWIRTLSGELHRRLGSGGGSCPDDDRMPLLVHDDDLVRVLVDGGGQRAVVQRVRYLDEGGLQLRGDIVGDPRGGRCLRRLGRALWRDFRIGGLGGGGSRGSRDGSSLGLGGLEGLLLGQPLRLLLCHLLRGLLGLLLGDLLCLPLREPGHVRSSLDDPPVRTIEISPGPIQRNGGSLRGDIASL